MQGVDCCAPLPLPTPSKLQRSYGSLSHTHSLPLSRYAVRYTVSARKGWLRCRHLLAATSLLLLCLLRRRGCTATARTSPSPHWRHREASCASDSSTRHVTHCHSLRLSTPRLRCGTCFSSLLHALERARCPRYCHSAGEQSESMTLTSSPPLVP
jgi:hypothetical protein